MDKKTLSRRDFIKAAGIAAGASLLAACSPQTVEVIQTQVVKETSVVKETQLVNQVVTATPAPTAVPEPAVMDIWAITTVEDLNAEWAPDPNNEEFKKQWWTGGMIRLQAQAFLDKHPGVTLKISGHNWDWALRENQYLALAAGITPDTGYGEAYVGEFAQLGVYAPVSDAARALFPESTYRAVTVDGKALGLAETTGANAMFINVDRLEQAGLDPASPPTTWDELVAAAQAVSEAGNGNAFFTYAPAQQSIGSILRISAWFEQNNAPIGSDLGVPTINVPGAADTWVFHNALMYTSTEDKILEIDAGSEPAAGAAIADGTVAFEIGWTNNASSVGAIPDANVIAIELPIPAGGKQATNLVGTQINSPFLNGPNPELAVEYIELSTTSEEAQAFKPNGCGIWIPALKSSLENYATYDKLGGFASDKSKELVRVTMKAALSGSPIPGWPKNGGRIWNAWNDSYAKIWHGNLGKDEIQAELDTLQATVTGLINA
jgi:ABC-type glycerol-3-phosphate transport system substrate-binding protein